MQAIRISKARVALPQRRLLASLPPAPPPSGATPVRPIVVTAVNPPPTPGSSTLPPRIVTAVPPPIVTTTIPPSLPPPPPPQPPRKPRSFRKYVIYTALGALTFYAGSGYASTKSDTFRDIFVNVPGGEAVAEYADEHNWETFGPGTIIVQTNKAIDYVKGTAPPASSQRDQARQEVGQQVDKAISESRRKADDLKAKARQAESKVEDKVVAGAKDVKAATTSAFSTLTAKATELKDKAVAATTSAGDKVKATGKEVEQKAKAAEAQAASKAKATAREAESATRDAAAKAKATGEDAAQRAKSAAQSTAASVAAAGHDVSAKAQELAHEAKEKVAETTQKVTHQFSEGVESMVREAERALGKGEEALLKAEKAVAPQPDGPRILPDTQRPRQLRPETVTPEKRVYTGEVYNERLPLGFEAPPGYYVPPPVKAAVPAEGAPLPLLAPKVREFAASEPIISQLASTIDSLTTSLSPANAGKPNDATGILSKAQDDLTALSHRIDEVKKAEKAKLEQTVGAKTKEFETLLAEKAEERKRGEQGLKAGWEKERSSMVDEWRTSLEKELETQREGIEKRLREEVVSQGIELQRRWLRSIKSQVETERGGRLAKLDHLSTSLKELERITLDNSATLDDNVRVHKIWSAIRAVNTKAEAGDVAFEEELRVLKSLVNDKNNSIIAPALNQIEASGAATAGVKSFAALSSWFTQSVSPRIHSASLVPAPEEATVLSHLASLTLSKIMFRPQPGLINGQDVSSTLARAEWCLSEKDLDGAAREVNSLSGWPAKLAGDWLREARRKLEVQQALEVVMTEATLDSLLLS